MEEKKKVFAVIDCSIPINTRNQKIINSLKSEFKDSDIHVITWNREGLNLTEDRFFHAYEKKATYADAKAKLKGLLGFRKYIHNTLEQINPNVIIASHWSNLMLVADAKKPNQILIYENLDIPTGSFPVRQISRAIENWCLRKVDLIIHASRFFRPLYKQSVLQFVIENKPVFEPDRKKTPTGKPLKVAFVGSVRYKDILMNLVDALKNNEDFELYFHGSGEDLDSMKEYCKDNKNVFFTGKYNYSQIVSLYHQADVIWAGYPNKDYNVVYAISNKFHESLYVGVPCVYSINTELASFVKSNNIGFVVDPYNANDIKTLFNEIASGEIDIEAVKKSMEEFQANESSWEKDFQQLVNFIKIE